MQRYTVYLETALHVSGGTSTHHQERIQLYRQSLVFVTPLLLPAAIATGSSKSVSTHPRHQPAATWMNTNRYCKYSQVLQMIGENIVRNM